MTERGAVFGLVVLLAMVVALRRMSKSEQTGETGPDTLFSDSLPKGE